MTEDAALLIDPMVAKRGFTVNLLVNNAGFMTQGAFELIDPFATALPGLDKERSLMVDGLKNSLLSHGPRQIPRWFAAQCAGQAVRLRSRPAGA